MQLAVEFGVSFLASSGKSNILKFLLLCTFDEILLPLRCSVTVRQIEISRMGKNNGNLEY